MSQRGIAATKGVVSRIVLVVVLVLESDNRALIGDEEEEEDEENGICARSGDFET